MYDYETGILDWKTAGLPVEGTSTQVPRLVDVVRRDVPTCSLGERLGDVRDRAAAAGWDACVVVSGGRVVLGLLRAAQLRVRQQVRFEVHRPAALPAPLQVALHEFAQRD